ncbi:P-selectin [Liparis tanakae]|uniref:p-selectin n=1 Tax=Liparis tanakae TaxID=230148 RepID=A0A4Z2EM36_9TELE|nr:P-selectin [Liparis tanakae]
MTWYEARTYCRSRYTDLVTVRNQSENEQIFSVMTTITWLGLHRKTWAYWSDQTPNTFTNWNENHPKHTDSRLDSCAAQTFKLKFQSKADLKDPAIQQQLLEQLHVELEKHGLSDFKLRWTQKDGQAFHKEQKMKKGPVW